MAVASKSPASTRKLQAPLKAKAATKHTPVRVILLTPKAKLHNRSRPGSQIPILPSSRPVPLWLLRLCSLQRRSFVVTFLLMAGMLSVYAWTVYSQQEWTQARRQLATLQRNERQLTATTEVLKNQMAQEAEQPATGLIPSESSTTIFMQPASPRSTPANQSMIAANSPAIKTNLTPMPLGY